MVSSTSLDYSRRRLTVTFLFSLSFFTGLFAQPDTWVQQRSLISEPSGRVYATAFSINGSGYIATGTDSSGYKNDVWEYGALQSEFSWSQKADFPGLPREGAVSFSIGNKAYLGTGHTGSGYAKDFWEYNSSTNEWKRKSDFGGSARAFAVQFNLHGKIYIATGFDGSFKKDVWQYDTSTDTWNQKANFNGESRSNAVAFSTAFKSYLGTGLTANGVTNDFWEYDDVYDLWSQKNNFPGVARASAIGFSILNKGFLGTGLAEIKLKDFWKYDPDNNTWLRINDFAGTARFGTVVINMPFNTLVGAGSDDFNFKNDFWWFDYYSESWSLYVNSRASRYGAVSFSIGNKGYIGAGSFLLSVKKDFWEFDALSNSWSQKADLAGRPRRGAIAFSVGNKGYIGSGLGGTDTSPEYLSDFWEYDPEKNLWRRKGDMPGGARFFGVGFSIKNKGYAGIGTTIASTGPSRDFWEYDPLLDLWTRKADFGGTARSLAVGFNIGDKGFIGTGSEGVFEMKDFWQYDPATNIWTEKAELAGPARASATGFGIGNKGYITTGRFGYSDMNPREDLWEYDLLTDTWTRKRDFPGGARVEANSFSIGNSGYVGFGLLESGTFFTAPRNDLWKYTPAKQSPVANGFLLKFYSPTSVLLNAWGSYDPDGGTVQFSWKKIAGPDQYLMVDSQYSTPTISNLVSGVYTFRLTVTDDDGDTATSDVSFTINAIANKPPIANGWLMKYYSANSVLLNGWGSYDPEGGPISFSWSKVAGPDQYTMLYGQYSTPLISDMVPGMYTFRLTVTDDKGATATSDVQVMVNGMSIIKPGEVLFPATVSSSLSVYPNPATNILKLQWSQDYKSPARITVTDMSGKTVISVKINSIVHSEVLNVHALKPGVYQIQMQMENMYLSTTFLKK